jgi:hypothetical protein
VNIRIYTCFIFCFLLLSCSHKKAYSESNPGLQIHRFDTGLYQYLTQNSRNETLTGYIPFLNEYGEKVIGIGKTDSTGFYERLRNYFSEPALMQLYRDEQAEFADISAINTELFAGMETLLQHFPALRQPEIYMHVSGLAQNVIVTDEILSLSADKYLGAGYPLYRDFFYDYQRQLMTPGRVVPDYLLGFLMANFPFQGNDEILLDRMLYEGKLRYILSQVLPQRKIWEAVAYTQEQYNWCTERQSRIWKSVLENQHLFKPDYRTTSLYLNEAPYTATLPSDSPGRAGIWLGFQIIVSYMKNHPETTWPELMNQIDYPELLKQSKFKP